jgi:hypothetical protein
MDRQASQTAGRATLVVGGQRVPMNRFVEGAVVGVVEGLLSGMRDVPPGEVTITIPANRRASPTGGQHAGQGNSA